MPVDPAEWEFAFAAELRKRHASFSEQEALDIAASIYGEAPALMPAEAVDVFLLEQPPLDAGEPGD